jgi:undecaprenyl-diphosphatase
MATTDKQVEEKAKRFSLSLLIVIVVFSLLLFLFAIITDEIVFEKETAFDAGVYGFLHPYTNPGLTRFMAFFTFFGSRTFLLPAYLVIVAYYLFYKKKSLNALAIAVIALGGAGILYLFKNIFRRDRPLEPLISKVTSFSYPSGHSFSAFTFSGILIYLVWISSMKKGYKWLITVLLFVFAALVAITRVYLHVHYASDVIAGFCLSLIWLTICYYTLKKFNLIPKVQTK